MVARDFHFATEQESIYANKATTSMFREAQFSVFANRFY